jgi:hypothetical protein
MANEADTDPRPPTTSPLQSTTSTTDRPAPRIPLGEIVKTKESERKDLQRDPLHEKRDVRPPTRRKP